MLSLPFPHDYLPDVGAFLSPLFESIATWSGRNVFGLASDYTARLISDSTGLYIHVANLVMIAIVVASLPVAAVRRVTGDGRAACWFTVIASYYLALQLFTYGFDKVFKAQFFLPEPNTLFTTVGETPADLLYWSVMGASRSYTVFTGILEVVAAVLLLFRRTRTIGGLTAFAILLNVVAINFSFDISVKIFSTFLLLLSCAIVAPDADRLAGFILRKDRIGNQGWSPECRTRKAHALYATAKGLVICIMLFDVLASYVVAANFNDDAAPRPPMHGAYEVTAFVANGDSIPPLATEHRRWRRAFVHRRGYLIVQTMDDRMKDYRLRLDTAGRRMLITDPYDGETSVLGYAVRDSSTVTLAGILHEDTLAVACRRLDLSALPLLRNEFHWTVDGL